MQLSDLPERYRKQAEEKLGLNRPTPIVSGGSVSNGAKTTAEVKKVHGLIHAETKQEEEEKKKSRKKEWLKPFMADTLVKRVEVSEDKNTVKIVLGCDPNLLPTAQEKGLMITKTGVPLFYTKKPQKDLETTLIKALSKYRHLSREWGEVPLEVILEYFFPYTKSTPKKNLFKISGMTETPDASNLTKGIVDAMTRCDYKDKSGKDSWQGNGEPLKGFWKDDSFIVNEYSRKRRTIFTPRINIIIKNLKPQFDKLHEEELAERAKLAEEAKKAEEEKKKSEKAQQEFNLA